MGGFLGVDPHDPNAHVDPSLRDNSQTAKEITEKNFAQFGARALGYAGYLPGIVGLVANSYSAYSEYQAGNYIGAAVTVIGSLAGPLRQIHHIIPRQFVNHPVIKTLGIEIMSKVNEISSLNHKGWTISHKQYNKEWGRFLNSINDRLNSGMLTEAEARAAIAAEVSRVSKEISSGKLNLSVTKAQATAGTTTKGSISPTPAPNGRPDSSASD